MRRRQPRRQLAARLEVTPRIVCLLVTLALHRRDIRRLVDHHKCTVGQMVEQRRLQEERRVKPVPVEAFAGTKLR